jgi:hypothetical protein
MKKRVIAAAIAVTLVLTCVISALADCPPHTFGSWVITLEPTCTHVGQKRAKCWECGVLYGGLEPVPALGHVPGQWIVTQEADCIFDEVQALLCDRCGMILASHIVPDTRHTPGDWIVTVQPTRTTEGIKEKRCIRCNIMMFQEFIPVLTGEVSGSIACSEGLRFKETRPGLTNKWYMYTPLDLSVNGKQTLPLIATNHYVIGSVIVAIANGKVHVAYRLNSDKVHVTKEFMTFFPDLTSVKTVDPEALEAQNFPFDTAVSIQENLAGDTSILLYVALSVNYNYFAAGILPYAGAGDEEEAGDNDSAFNPPVIDVSDLSRYHTLRIGTIDPDVAKLKLRLYELGYYKRANENKTYTEATAEVVAAFQKANGLKADGVATPETQAVLYSDGAVRNK